MSGGFENKSEGGSGLTAAEVLWVQTGNSGVVLLAEQASSPTNTSGFGKIYVKTDKILYYLDEDGVEVAIGGASVGGIDVETPTGTIDGANTVFSAVNEPKIVVADGMSRFPSAGVTITGTGPYTITFDALIPPVESIRSVYNV